MAEELTERLGQARFQSEGGIEAGLIVECGGAVLDASLQGLLRTARAWSPASWRWSRTRRRSESGDRHLAQRPGAAGAPEGPSGSARR